MPAWVPQQASNTAQRQRRGFWFYLAVFSLAGVPGGALMMYFVVAYAPNTGNVFEPSYGSWDIVARLGVYILVLAIFGAIATGVRVAIAKAKAT